MRFYVPVAPKSKKMLPQIELFREKSMFFAVVRNARRHISLIGRAGDDLSGSKSCRRKVPMTKTICKRLICLVLVVLMFTSVTPAFAATAGTEAGDGQSSLKDISDSLNAKTYSEYSDQHKDVKRGTQVITIDAWNYDEESTTADVSIVNNHEGKSGKSLRIGDMGIVTWNVNVPEEGMYAIKLDFISDTDKTNSIERVLYINDSVPFSEARYLALKKTWVNEYTDGRFALDSNGNELRPRAKVLHEWKTSAFTDSNGFYANEFEFYFQEGENTISLEGVRESVIINSITLFPYEDKPTYEEYIQGKSDAGADVEVIHVDAEMPSRTSDFTIYPLSDRTSALSEPQDAAKIRLNTIGREKWQTAGQWIEYEVEVEEAGLYEIVLRYKQSELAGMYTSRKILIDGVVPFEEANYAKFNYDSKWQVAAAGDGASAFKFYLEPGKHTITFEVTLGEMGVIVREVSDIMKSINNDYLEILKLTGSEPDEYRDYGFGRVLPDVVKDLLAQAKKLDDIIDYIENVAKIKSENSATLEQIARLLYKMGTDEGQIAKNLGDLKGNVGTLGEWINNVKNQPLEIDWIEVKSSEIENKEAEAGFFKSFIYEIKQFAASFVTDYNSLGASDDESDLSGKTVEVWVTTGRDQAQIMRNLIDNNFGTQYDIDASLKLVAGGTLLPSVLAKAGPDVALPGTGADPIQYAIRSAVLALNPEAYEDQSDDDEETREYNAEMREIFSDFDEITDRFTDAALIPLTLYGKTYGLPDTQTWPMMFYRTDILTNLGVDVPETWDDLLALIPVLQFNNMTIGMPRNYQIFLYQMDGELWADDGMRINLDTNLSLEAFETMCNMFTQYSLPTVYDAANRFRTGEMPIFISEYTTYNNIIIFATELAGLWEFGPIPGIRREDGTVNNSAISTVNALCMMRGVHDVDSAWKFMCWYTDKEFQVDYSNELVALLGPAGKNATANMEALEELPWTSREYDKLMQQMSNTTAITPYPGSYILERYTNFAFNAAYNNHADPVDSLLEYINDINKEITRKRTEFNLETLKIGETLASKRLAQAVGAIGELDDSIRNSDAVAAVLAAIESEDIAQLREAAEGLGTSDEALIQIASYINDAANALESYINK